MDLMNLWAERRMRGTIYTFKVHGHHAGFLLLENWGYAKVIRGLFVKDDYRGYGIGSYLIKLVTHTEGKYGIVVNITRGAENLYRNQGFKIIGVREDFPDQSIAFWGDVPEHEKEIWEKKVKLS